MTDALPFFDTVFLGAGPAGTGALVSAARHGSHAEFLSRGMLWADAGAAMGTGTLGRFAIPSDTIAKVLLECLVGAQNPLRGLQQHPAARKVASFGEGPLPLPVAGAYLQALGAGLHDLVAASTRSAFWPHQKACGIVRMGTGRFAVAFDTGRRVLARQVVLAMGGWHDAHYASHAPILGPVGMADVDPSRVLASHDLLSTGGVLHCAPLLQGQTAGRAVIVGASHSAVTAANLLLDNFGETFGEDASITLLCRRLPKVFYPHAEAAWADGYRDFGADDICPVTHRVYRLAGLRLGSRDLVRRVLGLGSLVPERRIRLVALETLAPSDVLDLLRAAHVVVPAFGYRPRTVPVAFETGAPLLLGAQVDRGLPLVNDQCEVLDAARAVVPGLFGMGLASGFVPRGPTLGGEPSFVGQTNGLWLYSHDLGDRMRQTLMREGPSAVAVNALA